MATTIQGLVFRVCRPMMNTPPFFKGLNVRTLMIIPVRGRGLLIRGLG